MFEERIAAMNQRTEESIVASTGQFDKRTYTVDEIQDILGISRTSAYNLVKKKAFHMCMYCGRNQQGGKRTADILADLSNTDAEPGNCS